MEKHITQFDEVQATANMTIQVAKSVHVVDADTAAKAKAFAVELKNIEGMIDEIRKEMVKPLNDEVKGINDYAKTLTLPIGQAKAELSGKIIAWQNEERMKAEIEAAAEKARLDAIAAQMAESGEATFEEVEAVQERAAVYAEPIKMLKHEKPLAVRDSWKFKVTDFKALAEYAVKTGQLWMLSPNESEIGKKVRAATGPLRNCPGLEIWSEQSAIIK